jgi:glycosyltransferase involved in cell wall biosynthesis
MMSPREIPIVLVTYNRPDHTRRVLEALKRHTVKNLFIYSDAARSAKDVPAVDKTRALIRAIDWATPVLHFQDSNQGLAKSIVAATDRVLQEHESVIVLEDDCVPQEHFFEFMFQCLGRYRNDEKIFGISGYSVPLTDEILADYAYDLYFFPRIGSWGWATWRRAWQYREPDLRKLLAEITAKGINLSQGGNDIPATLEAMLRGHAKDIWTLNWVLSTYLHQATYIYPTVSHVENIGMDGTGVHCGITDKFVTPLSSRKPERFPDRIFNDKRIHRQFRSYYDLPALATPAAAFQETQVTLPASQGKKSILHLVEALTTGGAGRAILACAKHSARFGNFHHTVLSLKPVEPSVLQLAAEAGVAVLHTTDSQVIHRLCSEADIVQVSWWNNPAVNRWLRSKLPPMRLAVWYHVAGDGPPQIITQELVKFADFSLPCSPYTSGHKAFQCIPEREQATRKAMVLGAADFERLNGFQKKSHANFNVGYIGTVDFIKMHPHFIRMSAAVNVPNVKFIVCGHGIEEFLKQEAINLGAGQRFDFRGFVEDIKGVLETLDVYGYPLCERTYAASELNLQEAMFAGVPPVVFPYGGIKYLVKDQQTGLVVANEREYVGAIEYLFHKPEERDRLGKNARAYALEHFGAENAGKELSRVYTLMLDQPKRTRTWRAEGSPCPGAAQAGTTNPGHRCFIESLGEHAMDFLTSANDQDTPESEQEALLHADARIAACSSLVFLNGIIPYQIHYPEDPYLQLWKGLVLEQYKRYQEASACFTEAIRQGNRHWRVKCYLARIMQALGRDDIARKLASTVLREAVNSPLARNLLGELTNDIPVSGGETQQSSIRVSAIVSTYNSELHIYGCLEDLTTQTLFKRNELEIVVVNTGSQENEETIIQDFQRRFSNIRYIKTPERQSVYGAWNLGVKAASGKYITNANTDDRHRPDALELMADHLDANPDVAVLYGDQLITSFPNDHFSYTKAERRWGWPEFSYEELERRCIVGPQPMWRKALHAKHGYFRDQFKSAGDYEFWLRIGKSEKIARFPETLGLYYDNPLSLEHGSTTSAQETLRIWMEYGVLQKGVIPKGSVPVSVRSEELRAQPFRQETRDCPTVSIVVPTFNRLDLLKDALASIDLQTYGNYEVLVVNDGGESAATVVKEFNSRGNFIYLEHETNKGRAAARNTGIRAAKGKYIAFLDDDDVYYPNHLAVLVERLEKSSERVAYTDTTKVVLRNVNGSWVTAEAKIIPHQEFRPDLLHVTNYIPTNSLMLERDCINRVGLFDESFEVLEDWELLIRLSRNYAFVAVPVVTSEVRWRTDLSNVTLKKRGDFIAAQNRIYTGLHNSGSVASQIQELQALAQHNLIQEVKKETLIQQVAQCDGANETCARAETLSVLLLQLPERVLSQAFLNARRTGHAARPEKATVPR